MRLTTHQKYDGHPGVGASRQERTKFWVKRYEEQRATNKKEHEEFIEGWKPINDQVQQQTARDPSLTKRHTLAKMTMDVLTKKCKRPSDFHKGIYLLARLFGHDQTTQVHEHHVYDDQTVSDLKKFLADHDVSEFETVPIKQIEGVVVKPGEPHPTNG